jgi:hypothetical protein
MPLLFTLGMLQRLEIATVIDHLLPLYPASVLLWRRVVAVDVLTIVDGHDALYKGRGQIKGGRCLRAFS